MTEQSPAKSNDLNLTIRFIQRIISSDILILAAFPIAAQAIITFYDLGYLGVYRLPANYIEFSLTTLVSLAVALLAPGVVVISFARAVISDARKSPPPVARRLMYVIPLSILFIVFFYLYGVFWQEWLWILIALALTVTQQFLWPLFRQRGKGDLAQKLEADEQRTQKPRKTTTAFTGPYGNLLGLLTFTAIVVAVTLFMAYHVGRSRAMLQQTFIVVNTKPETIVLWTTETKMILVPFDRNTKEIDPAFIILNTGDPNVLFRWEQIGILTVKPIPTAQPVTSQTPLPTVSPSPVVSATPTQQTPTITPSNQPTATP